MVENNILDIFFTHIAKNPTYNSSTDVSSFPTDNLFSNNEKYCGDSRSEQRRIHVNLLKLKLFLD